MGSGGTWPDWSWSEGTASRSLTGSSGSGAADLQTRRDGGPSLQAHGTCPAGGARWHHAGQRGPGRPRFLIFTWVPKGSVTTRRFSMAPGIHGCRGHTALRGWWPSVGQCRKVRPSGVSRTCRRPLAGGRISDCRPGLRPKPGGGWWIIIRQPKIRTRYSSPHPCHRGVQGRRLEIRAPQSVAHGIRAA